MNNGKITLEEAHLALTGEPLPPELRKATEIKPLETAQERLLEDELAMMPDSHQLED